jgi:hypothetical protein
MAAVSTISVDPVPFIRAGSEVGFHLEAAAKPVNGAVPAPVSASPVDAAATGARTAIQTKMTAMQAEIGTKGPQMQAAAAAAAAALQAQDANNASPLKDLASAIPSGGGSSGGGGGGSKSGIQAVDYHTGDGRTIPSPPPRQPGVINANVQPPPPPPPPDPKHTSATGQPVCPGDQIIGNLLQILMGGAGLGVSIPAEAPTLGAATVVLGGALTSIYNGIDGLERCPP